MGFYNLSQIAWGFLGGKLFVLLGMNTLIGLSAVIQLSALLLIPALSFDRNQQA